MSEDNPFVNDFVLHSLAEDIISLAAPSRALTLDHFPFDDSGMAYDYDTGGDWGFEGEVGNEVPEERVPIPLALSDPERVQEGSTVNVEVRPWNVFEKQSHVENLLWDELHSFNSNKLKRAQSMMPTSVCMFFAVPLFYASLSNHREHEIDPAFHSNGVFQVSTELADLFLLDSLRRRVCGPTHVPYLLFPTHLAAIENWSHWDGSTISLPEQRVRDLLADSWKLGSPTHRHQTAPIPTTVVTAIKFRSGWVGLIATCGSGRPQLTVFDAWASELPFCAYELEHANLYKIACLIFAIMRVAHGKSWNFTPGRIWQLKGPMKLAKKLEYQQPQYGRVEYRGSSDHAGVKSLAAFSWFDRQIAYYFGSGNGPTAYPIRNPGWRALALIYTNAFEHHPLNDQLDAAARVSMSLLDWQLDHGLRAAQDQSFYSKQIWFLLTWAAGARSADHSARREFEDPDDPEDGMYESETDGEPTSADDSTVNSYPEEDLPDLDTALSRLADLPEIHAPSNAELRVMNWRQLKEHFLDPRTGTWKLDFLQTEKVRLVLDEVPTIIVNHKGDIIGGGAARRIHSSSMAVEPAEEGMAVEPAEEGMAVEPAEEGIAVEPAEEGMQLEPMEEPTGDQDENSSSECHFPSYI